MRNVLLALSPAVLALTAFGQQSASKPAATPVPTPRAAAVAPAPNTPAPPEHPLTTEQAKELMQLTGTAKLKPELVDNMHKYFQRSFPPFVPEDVKTDLNASIDKMDVETPVIDVYKKYLSTEDAAKAIEFYKTPAGHRIAESAPMLNAEVQKAATQVGQQTAKDAIDRHRPEIEAAQKKYQEEHAAAKPSLGGPAGASAPASPAKPTTPPAASTPAPATSPAAPPQK